MKVASAEALHDKLQSTSGGLRDTELNELAVKPLSVPSADRVVMTVTPVANVPRHCLNSVLLNEALSIGKEKWNIHLWNLTDFLHSGCLRVNIQCGASAVL